VDDFDELDLILNDLIGEVVCADAKVVLAWITNGKTKRENGAHLGVLL
jgi:hypothetical protein